MELAINKELGIQNHYQRQQHNKTLIPARMNTIHFPLVLDH